MAVGKRTDLHVLKEGGSELVVVVAVVRVPRVHIPNHHLDLRYRQGERNA